MKTKIFKSWLHVWITLASTASFVGGWIAFAHSPVTPETATVTDASAAVLTPVPALDTLVASSGSGGTTLQPLTTYQLSQSSTTMLRTGGS